MSDIQIIHEPSSQESFIIINKPSGIPTAPLNFSDENNALFQVKKAFPVIEQVKGIKDCEFGLLHRIDTVTSGLVLIATSQEFYDYMLEQQKKDLFIKYYRASSNKIGNQTLEGFPNPPDFDFNKTNTISSYFRPFGPGRKEVRPVSENESKTILKKIGQPKIYTTSITVTSDSDVVSTECKITNGYRHQVRCHLAWCGLPIINDIIYNEISRNKEASDNIKFQAFKIEFNDLNNNRKVYEI